MERYIEQLIEDIRRAGWRIRPPHEIWHDVDLENEAEQEDISHVEKYIYGTEEKISSITGIDQIMLPATEKLTNEQSGLLASELEKLLNIFHFHLDFPDKFPLHLRYPLIRNFWNEEHVPISFGESHIEFCSYDKDDCPFSGYCNICEEMEEEMKMDEQRENTQFDDDFELPF